MSELSQGSHLSLVIPAFDERDRILTSLRAIFDFLEAQDYSYEVLLVDDGSKDETLRVVQAAYGDKAALRIQKRPCNQGKGSAIKHGMLLARGRYRFFTDADLSVPIDALPVFLRELEEADVAIASRQKPGSQILVRQPPHRELMGKAFTSLANLVLGLHLSDFTCGFKGFRAAAAKELFSRQRLKNWAFDAEILYLARLKRLRIAEVPVAWRHHHATKVKLWKDAAASFAGLLKIRANHLMGKYR